LIYVIYRESILEQNIMKEERNELAIMTAAQPIVFTDLKLLLINDSYPNLGCGFICVSLD